MKKARIDNPFIDVKEDMVSGKLKPEEEYTILAFANKKNGVILYSKPPRRAAAGLASGSVYENVLLYGIEVLIKEADLYKISSSDFFIECVVPAVSRERIFYIRGSNISLKENGESKNE